MLKLKIFTFNPFQVNTYLVYNEAGDCMLFDAACQTSEEKETLINYIEENKLKISGIYSTHGHIDHIMGNKFLHDKTNAPIYMHQEDLFLVKTGVEHAMMFGLRVESPPVPENFLAEKDKILKEDIMTSVLHLPGHSPGSIGFYFENEKFIILGDVLFNGSIGRTDLPGGDYNTLVNSIKSKLFPLGDDVVVYCGHGPATTIGDEKRNNPFLS
ncbi:MAG: MBL fold metallo-hydrolase [Bacteroidota bacterium]